MAKGIVERIGIEGAFLDHKAVMLDKKTKLETTIPNHAKGIKMVFDILLDKEYGVIKDMSEIKAVGHRVAHGGEKFPESAIIDQQKLAAIEDLSRLAPLHNPHNAMGLKVVRELLPNVQQVAVFDTSFHQTMPAKAYIYPLPYELYQKLGVRRYGFHGTSHKFVAEVVAKEMGKSVADLKIITAHLGNGASITAIDGGKSVDTSMGFTPLEGLVMGTRSGDIDPAIVTFLQKNKQLSAEEVDNLLNKKSGLLGISGVSSDSRDVEEKAAAGNEQSQLAVDIFCYRVKKYIGAYAAAMGGLDVLVFTAGIGENSHIVRSESVKGLEFLGLKIDENKNNVRGKLTDLSAAESRVKIFVVPTNEELVIAKETMLLLNHN